MFGRTLLFAALLPLAAAAQDVVVTHHGRLLDGNDAPVEGTKAVVVGLFTTSIDVPGQGPAAALWSESYEVKFTNGAYSLPVGSTAGGKRALPSSLFEENVEVYLGLELDGVRLSPRLRLFPLPRAVHADRAGKANDLDCEGCVAANELAPGALDGLALADQSCPAGQKVTGVAADGTVTCAEDANTTYAGANFAVSNQACPEGQKVTGVAADGTVICGVDANTTYDGTNFAASNQACPAGQKVTGVSANGAVTCAVDADTKYDGSDFAKANQACPAGQKVTGVSATGAVTCAADVDTKYDGSDFAIANQACPAGQKVTGVSASGAVQCGADLNLAPSCYTRWGSWGCAAGFDEVMRGRPGGHEGYHDGGAQHGNVECVASAPTALNTWTSGYANRLMYGTANGAGMVKVPSRCSICCTGGCFTALGTNTCPDGYTRVYAGRTGGVEGFQGGSIFGKTLCIDTSSTASNTWSSGYNARLMRHRETGGSSDNGMDRIDNLCAQCCKTP